MINIQRSNERGRTRAGWLDSRHAFSFGEYWNPARTGLGPLIVLNEDLVQPGTGFGPHSHRDMEILTFVTSGVLRHRDSIGSESDLKAGTAQAMRAGTGIRHAEFNGSDTDEVSFVQIWVRPRHSGLVPAYAELPFFPPSPDVQSTNVEILTIASPDGRDGSFRIDNDAVVSVLNIPAGKEVTLTEEATRRSWLQILEGSTAVGEQTFNAGDGASILNERGVGIGALSNTRAILLDLHEAH
jgi:redox-sensitive bicupin YhaK (pirin superfamily)